MYVKLLPQCLNHSDEHSLKVCIVLFLEFQLLSRNQLNVTISKMPPRRTEHKYSPRRTHTLPQHNQCHMLHKNFQVLSICPWNKWTKFSEVRRIDKPSDQSGERDRRSQIRSKRYFHSPFLELTHLPTSLDNYYVSCICTNYILAQLLGRLCMLIYLCIFVCTLYERNTNT